MLFSAIPGRPRWRDLSTRHERIRQALEQSLLSFSKGDYTAPVAVVGAFGSGKTELMSWGFRFCWEHQIPALWITLGELLEYLPGAPSGEEFARWLDCEVRKQLGAIARSVENNGPVERLWLPGASYQQDQCIGEYFESLEIPSESVRSALSADERTLKGVLFVDEMEARYTELLRRVSTDERAPLRSVLDAIEKRQTCFFLVMSFGLGSAYEALSGAEARRQTVLTIPMPDIEQLGALLEPGAPVNFLWWASRGRPGWALPLWASWRSELEAGPDRRFDAIRRLQQQMRVDGIPAVDWGRVAVLRRAGSLDVLTEMVLSLGPTDASRLRVDREVLEELWRREYLSASDELVDVGVLTQALTNDLMKLWEREVSRRGAREASPQPIISSYLSSIIRGFSVENKICLGGWKSETESFVVGWLAPLIILLHDFVLEFEGDTEVGAATVDFLYSLATSWGLFSGAITAGGLSSSAGDIATRFSETRGLFRTSYQAVPAFIQASPKLVEELFPRLIVRPVLRLSEQAGADIAAQRNRLQGTVASTGRFLSTVSGAGGDCEVHVILLPSVDLSHRLQRTMFSQMRRAEYLPYRKVFVILNLDPELRQLEFDPKKNSDIDLLYRLCKLRAEPLNDRRLQDFLISVWHNANVLELEKEELFDVIESITRRTDLPRATYRTIEHYSALGKEFLDRLAEQARKDYLDHLRDLLPVHDQSFPRDRIQRLRDAIRETRTIEYLLLCLGAYRRREATIRALAGIRQLASLNRFKELGRGYGELIRRYTVTRDRTGDTLSQPMREVVTYLAQRKGFVSLRSEIFSSLSPSGEWEPDDEAFPTTPVEEMFPGSNKELTLFVKALYLAALAQLCHDRIARYAKDVVERVRSAARQYQQLANAIRMFNDQLPFVVLSDRGCIQVCKDLEKLAGLVDDGCHHLDPASLWVVSRIAGAICAEASDMLARWRGEKGLEGWHTKLRVLTDMTDAVHELRRDLTEAFEKHTQLKEEAIGELQGVISAKLDEPIDAAVQEIRASLGTQPYELRDEIPEELEVWVQPAEEALARARSEVEEVCRYARQIDDLMAEISQLKLVIETVWRGR